MSIPDFMQLRWPTTADVHDIVRPLGVPVGTRTPRSNTLPPSFVKAFRVGGVTSDVVADRAIYIFEFYASTEEDAEALAYAARDLINAAPYGRGNPVRSVTWASGVASLPDPDTPKHERYTFTVELALRASPTPTPTP